LLLRLVKGSRQERMRGLLPLQKVQQGQGGKEQPQ
jgi:hypothetical protein